MVKNNKITTEKLGWLFSQTVDYKFELLRNHIEMSKILLNEILEYEVRGLSGDPYSRHKPNEGRYSRWGHNPGSVRLGDEKIPVLVPRVYDNQENKNKSLTYYQTIKKLPEPSEEVMKRVILGISQHDYEQASKEYIDSFGLSQSSVSRMFIESTSKALEKFESRNFGDKDIIAILIDGKSLSNEEVLICLGITMKGEKIVLGFAQSSTENSRAIKQLLKQLISRGLVYRKGLLVISDGSKAIKKAINEVFGKYYLHQRCQWHKREDVISYLNKEDQEQYRKKLQRAYSEPEYEKAKKKLLEIQDELKKINISAYRSLEEGFEATLTLHKLGLIEKIGTSLSTTNCIESLNSQLGRYIRRITRWQNSSQIYRWVASGLMESERRMHKIKNYKKLYLLRDAIMKTLKIKTSKLSKAA
jgi:putative transposase